MIKKLIAALLRKKTIEKIKNNLGVPSQGLSFQHLKKIGVTPRKVLDIGAYEGVWATDFKAYFPAAEILMFEAQIGKENKLKEVKSKYDGRIDYKIALLASSIKEVEFNQYETASSFFKEDNETNAEVVITTTHTLDNLLENTNFQNADFIKMDVQGAELEVLKGAEKTLRNAEFVLIEVSFLNIYKGAPLAHDIINFMHKKGFVIYDIASLMRRPYDNALNQSDFLFIKENSEIRSSTRWN